jgi:hypothetical protein
MEMITITYHIFVTKPGRKLRRISAVGGMEMDLKQM